MKKYQLTVLCLAACLLPSYVCKGTNWLVGPTRTYVKPSLVSTLVQNGDTVSIDVATYTADCCKWTANNLLIRGAGGRPVLDANNTSYGQKGIFVIAGNNCKVDNIEFANCHDAAGLDMNWAGIRQEGLNLTVSRCYFHDNDNGILAGTFNPSKMVIEYTEFDHNGYGDGYSHNLYINHLDTLIFRYNYSHHATIGHELKSRAHVNYILFNRFSNEATGDASREIDLPDGGLAIVMGNIIEQGPNSTNSGIIGYGMESYTNNAPHNLYLINNTIINDRSTGTYVSVGNGMNIYKSYNNIFAGPGNFFSGTPATTDTMNNWKLTSIASAGFVNAPAYDYHLTAGSGAINGGSNAGTASNGYVLTPSLEYIHPAGSGSRIVNGLLDKGAHESSFGLGTPPSGPLDDEFHCWVSGANIAISSSLQSVEVSLYDLNGKELLVRTITRGVSFIEADNLISGIYLLRAVSNGQHFVKKILVH